MNPGLWRLAHGIHAPPEGTVDEAGSPNLRILVQVLLIKVL